jgi:hypothetical protein
MSGVGIHQGYDVSAQHMEISNSVMSCDAQRAQPATSSLKAIACASGNQSAGGTLLFNLPSSPAEFIKDGSAYLRFTLKLTGAGNAGDCAGGNAISSWCSVINRLTLQSNGVLEQIQYYGSVYEPLLMEHTAGFSYYNADYAIMAKQPITVGAAGDYRAVVVLPLLNGAFNSPSGQNFPLCLFPSGLQLQLDLASDFQAIDATNNIGVTFTIENAFFHYEAVDVGMEYVNSLRQTLIAENRLFEMPFVSALVMAVNSAASIDNTFGVGLLSMKSVLTTNIPNRTDISTDPAQTYQGSNNFRVYADGRLLNMWNIPAATANGAYGDPVTQYALLQSALDNMASRVSATGPTPANSAGALTNYTGKFWCTGVSANHFEEHGFLSLQGTKVNQLQVHVELPNLAAAGGSTYFAIFMDCILAISPATGEATVIR